MQPEISCCCGGCLDHCRYSAHFDCPVDCRHVTFLLLFWRFSDVHCQNCDALYANEHQYNNNIVILNQTIKICKSKLGLWQIKTLVYNAILDLQTHDGQILTAPIAQRCNATSQSLKACIVHSDAACVCGWVGVGACHCITKSRVWPRPKYSHWMWNYTAQWTQTILFFQLLHDVISSCCRRQGNGDHKP